MSHEQLPDGRSRLLRAQEVADRLGIAVSTVYAWAERGILPAQRIRRCLRFDPAALAKWLATQPAPGAGLGEADDDPAS